MTPSTDNEELADLLSDDPEKQVRLLEDPKKGLVIQGLDEVNVTNASAVLELMRRALKRRTTAETLLNKSSSRSHCIFTLTVNIREMDADGEEQIRVGRLCVSFGFVSSLKLGRGLPFGSSHKFLFFLCV